MVGLQCVVVAVVEGHEVAEAEVVEQSDNM